MVACSMAYPMVGAFIAEQKLPLEVLLESGRKAAEELNCQYDARTMQCNIEVKCSPLLTRVSKEQLRCLLKDNQPFQVVAPMVLVIDNAHTEDFKTKVLKVIDELPHTESRSGSNRSNLRACIIREKGRENDETPIFKLGDNSIRSVPASELETLLINMHTELMNMFQDASREKQWELLGLKPPKGYVSWRTVYTAAAEEIKSGNNVTKTRNQKRSKWDDLTNLVGREDVVHHPLAKHIDDESNDNILRFHANSLIIKAGEDARYGPHKDSCLCLISSSHACPHELGDGTVLPTEDEMSVCTLTMEAGDDAGNGTSLQHTNKATKEVVSSVVTSKIGYHLQSLGCQGGDYVHSSKIIPSKAVSKSLSGKAGTRTMEPCYGGKRTRVVFTSRRMSDPSFDVNYRKFVAFDGISAQSVYHKYDYVEVISGRKFKRNTTHYKNPLPDQWELNEETDHKPTKVNPVFSNTNYYKMLNKQEHDKFHEEQVDLQQMMPELCQFDGEMAQGIAKMMLLSGFKIKKKIYMHHMLIDYLLRKQCLLSIGGLHQQTGRIMPLFVSPELVPYLPGDHVRTNLLKKSRMQKHIIDPANPTTVSLEHPYKSHNVGIDVWHHFCVLYRQYLEKPVDPDTIDAQREALKKHYDALPPIITCGSGGSASDPGNKIIGKGMTKPGYLHHTSPQSQNPSSRENATLLQLAAFQTPVNVLINQNNFLQKADKRSFIKDKHTKEHRAMIKAAYEFINSLLEECEQPVGHDYLNLAIFRLHNCEYKKGLTPEEILDWFCEIPGYPKRHPAHTSFMREQHIVMTFVKVTTFETMEIMVGARRSASCGVCRILNVVNDSQPVGMELGAVAEVATAEIGDSSQQQSILAQVSAKSQYPTQWLNTTDHLKWMLTQPLSVVENVLGAVEATSTNNYSFTVEEAVNMMLLSAGSVAARGNPANCSRFSSGNVYACPLINQGSDSLPEFLRTRPTPHPNSDYDVVNCFFYHNATLHLQNHNVEPGQKLSSINDAMAKIIVDLVFMSLFLRLTGDVERLATFSKTLHGSTSSPLLPVPETIKPHLEYMRSESGSLNHWLSYQHRGQLPKSFKCEKTGLGQFCSFFLKFGDKNDGLGVSSLIPVLLSRTRTLKRRTNKHKQVDWRTKIKETLIKAIDNCAPGVKKDSSLHFLAHRCLADVEMIILECFGDVTFRSLGFGPGSNCGLWAMRAVTKCKRNEHPFEMLHTMLLNELNVMSSDKLRVLGYCNNNGIILSLLTERTYSMTDTEHICCKLYIATCLADPSRNNGKAKLNLRKHCWPLFGDYDWVSRIQPFLDNAWVVFLSLDLIACPRTLVWTHRHYWDPQTEE